MPKVKTHSGIKKRVKLSKSNHALRRHASGNHFLQKKSAARKRRFRGFEKITGKNRKNIRQLRNQ